MVERRGEDLLTTLLSSLDELAKKSAFLNKWLIYAIILIIIWSGVAIGLWAISLINLNLTDIILYAILISLVLLVLIYLLQIREKLAEVISRYSAYKYLESLSLEIPPGRDPVERLINYFNKTLNFEKEIKKRGGIILKGGVDCGTNINFDYYAEIKTSALGNLLGRKSYSFFVRYMEKLTLEDIKKFIEDVRICSKKRDVEISRAIVLTTQQEMSDELYEFLMQQENLPLQVVMEMEDGTYDFIPFIAPRHDMLP